MLEFRPMKEAWEVPTVLDVTFEGFGPDAFAILDRLRARPHIEQYRAEKDGVRRALTDPFKRFRDDLVVNWVLANGLPLETEKNVFSRLLKNDFGAGGCHHHLWMAFYRPGRRRLTDVQLSHTIRPEGFETGLFVGEYGGDLLRQVKRRIAREPARFLALVNPLLQNQKMAYYYGSGARKVRRTFEAPLPRVPDDLLRADGLWIRRRVGRDDVLALQSDLVRWALTSLRMLWPVYLFMVEEDRDE